MQSSKPKRTAFQKLFGAAVIQSLEKELIGSEWKAEGERVMATWGWKDQQRASPEPPKTSQS